MRVEGRRGRPVDVVLETDSYEMTAGDGIKS